MTKPNKKSRHTQQKNDSLKKTTTPFRTTHNNGTHESTPKNYTEGNGDVCSRVRVEESGRSTEETENNAFDGDVDDGVEETFDDDDARR